MLNREDLLAISNLLDVKFKPVKDDIAELKEDVNSLNQRVGNLEEGMSSLNRRVGNLETDVRRVCLTLETGIEPRLQNIENCYISTYKRYSDGVNKIEELQEDVKLLKGVAAEHGEQINRLAEAM